MGVWCQIVLENIFQFFKKIIVNLYKMNEQVRWINCWWKYDFMAQVIKGSYLM